MLTVIAALLSPLLAFSSISGPAALRLRAAVPSGSSLRFRRPDELWLPVKKISLQRFRHNSCSPTFARTPPSPVSSEMLRLSLPSILPSRPPGRYMPYMLPSYARNSPSTARSDQTITQARQTLLSIGIDEIPISVLVAMGPWHLI